MEPVRNLIQERARLHNEMTGLGGPFREIVEEDLLIRTKNTLKALPINQKVIWVCEDASQAKFVTFARIVSLAFDIHLSDSEITTNLKTSEEGAVFCNVEPDYGDRNFTLEFKGKHLSITPVRKE